MKLCKGDKFYIAGMHGFPGSGIDILILEVVGSLVAVMSNSKIEWHILDSYADFLERLAERVEERSLDAAMSPAAESGKEG